MIDIKEFIKWLRKTDKCTREHNFFIDCSEESPDYDFIYLDELEEYIKEFEEI